MFSCIVCHGDKVNEIVENNQRYFYCKTCKKVYERALMSRLGKDKAVQSRDGIWHTSVGALIRKDSCFLLIKRRSFPFGYDFPAGHVEYNEEPIEALEREVMEETGLKVVAAKLIYSGPMKGNKCKYGADNHNWFFYDATCQQGIPFQNPESEWMGWYTLEESKLLDLIPSAQILLEKTLA